MPVALQLLQCHAARKPLGQSAFHSNAMSQLVDLYCMCYDAICAPVFLACKALSTSHVMLTS